MGVGTDSLERQTDSVLTVRAVSLFLAEQQNDATHRAYAADLKAFFGDEVPERVEEFLALPRARLARRLRAYKADLLERGLSEATVNRRLSTVRSLLSFAHGRGMAACDGRGLVEGERRPASPDTSVASLLTLKRLMVEPGTRSLRGQRDTAILHLLCENALRLTQICLMDIDDFLPGERQIRVPVRGSQGKQQVPLSQRAARALSEYVAAVGHPDQPGMALFRNVDHRPGIRGARLTVEGLYGILREHCRSAAIEGLTPHKLRRSAIVGALGASKGPVQRVLWTLQDPERLDQVAGLVSEPNAAANGAGRRPRSGTPLQGPARRLRRVLKRSRHGETSYFVTAAPDRSQAPAGARARASGANGSMR